VGDEAFPYSRKRAGGIVFGGTCFRPLPPIKERETDGKKGSGSRWV